MSEERVGEWVSERKRGGEKNQPVLGTALRS